MIGSTLKQGDIVNVRESNGETSQLFFENGPYDEGNNVWIYLIDSNGEVSSATWNESESIWEKDWINNV